MIAGCRILLEFAFFFAFLKRHSVAYVLCTLEAGLNAGLLSCRLTQWRTTLSKYSGSEIEKYVSGAVFVSCSGNAGEQKPFPVNSTGTSCVKWLWWDSDWLLCSLCTACNSLWSRNLSCEHHNSLSTFKYYFYLFLSILIYFDLFWSVLYLCRTVRVFLCSSWRSLPYVDPGSAQPIWPGWSRRGVSVYRCIQSIIDLSYTHIYSKYPFLVQQLRNASSNPDYKDAWILAIDSPWWEMDGGRTLGLQVASMIWSGANCLRY